MVEIPIFTKSVPFWQLLKRKRLTIQRTSAKHKKSKSQYIYNLLDKIRFLYPRKLDFCRMNFSEMSSTINEIIKEDLNSPDLYKPIVLIGHSKDLIYLDHVKALLDFLRKNSIPVTTFQGTLANLQC